MKAKRKKILMGISLITTITLASVGLGFYFHNNVIFRGTVTYLSFEGGFYGIVSDAGDGYDPINLPIEFEEDGLRVFVVASRNLGLLSIHGWGEIIEIRSIRLL